MRTELDSLARERLEDFQKREAPRAKQEAIWWEAFQQEMRRQIANGETDRMTIKKAAREAADKTKKRGAK